jgi:tetratricopeptide (TPR) repeat protein
MALYSTPGGKTLTLTCCLTAAAIVYAERVDFSDARGATLGNSPALDSGFYALGTNPAALSELPHFQFTFNHRIYPAPHAALEVVGAAVPFGDYGTLAGGFGTVRVGEVEQYSPNGRYLGKYVYHDDLIACGYGIKANRWVALGAAANYERHLNAPEIRYRTLSADAGVYVRPLGANSSLEYAAGTVALALTVQNLLASRRDIFTGEYREPVKVGAGALWVRDVGRHRLGLTFSIPFAQPSSAAIGCEFAVAAVLSARAGVTGTQPAGGIGVNTDMFSVDYSYLTRESGASHYFSVSINPGRDIQGRGEQRRQIEEWLREGRSYFEAGRYDLAAARFASVLNWDPHNAVARQYWARSRYHRNMADGAEFIGNKDWERARRAFRDALAVVPRDFLATEYLERVDELEDEEKKREAAEKRIAELLAQADGYRRRGAYRPAINIYEGILAEHPGHAQTRRLLRQTRMLLAATAKPPEPEPATPGISAEAIGKYEEATDLLSRGAVGEAARTLADVVKQYPDYAAARAKLVEAYTYQGLDFYSKGSLAAALRVWEKALALDPENEKLKRYINKAEIEIDQIR